MPKRKFLAGLLGVCIAVAVVLPSMAVVKVIQNGGPGVSAIRTSLFEDDTCAWTKKSIFSRGTCTGGCSDSKTECVNLGRECECILKPEYLPKSR